MSDDWTEDLYVERTDRGEYPKAGFFKIRLRKGGDWVPAEIRTGVSIDPLTGEILDRSPGLDGYICGVESDIKRIFVWGQHITREEFKWLTAITAIRRQNF